MDFGPFISIGKLVVRFRKKLSPANLIAIIDDGWLAARAYFSKEWHDPTWDLGTLADDKMLTERTETMKKETAARRARDEANRRINPSTTADEFNAVQREVAELGRLAEHHKRNSEAVSHTMATDLLFSLRDGTILAKGFLSPHVARRRPVIIPPHEWAILTLNTDEFDNAKAIGAGIEYIGVKLARRVKRR